MLLLKFDELILDLFDYLDIVLVILVNNGCDQVINLRIYQLVAPVGDHEVELVLQNSLLLIFQILALDQSHQSDQHVHHLHYYYERANDKQSPKEVEVRWAVTCLKKEGITHLGKAHLV